MNRTRTFLYNTVTTGFLQLVNMLAGFVVPQVMLRYYGSEINGLVTSVTQFIAYFNLVEAGLASAAVYSLYKPLADRDTGRVSAICSAAKKFYTQSGYLFTSLVLGMALIYPAFIRTSSMSYRDVALLVVVLGANGVLEFFTLAKYRVLLTADQKTYVISLASTVQIILNTAIIALLAAGGYSIVVVRAVAILAILLRSAILLIYTRKKYPQVDYRATPDKSALNKRWDALYLQILGAIQTGAPVVLATLLLGDMKQVSVYTVFYMVIGGVNSILSVFTTGLSAAFGDILARKEQSSLERAYDQFEFAYYSMITVTYSICLVMIMPFIRIYTAGITDVAYDLPLLGFLFVLNGLLFNAKTPQGMLVISAGLYRETRVQTTIQGLIVVMVGAALAPGWGLYGIMIASCLSNLYRDIDLLFFIPKHVTHLPVKNSALRLLRAALSFGLLWVIFSRVTIAPAGYTGWFLWAVIVGCASLVVVGLCGLIFDRAAFKALFARCIRLLKR